MNRLFQILTSLLVIQLSSCTSKEGLFRPLPPEESGIHFENRISNTPELNILNYLYFYNGAGVAAADFNNDGLTDLYFTSNQQADKLYLNLGGLRFRDITENSGISNADGWTTGVTTADVNHDGLPDLYICKLGQHLNIKGRNQLYINLGPDANGIPKFREEASLYGLDISTMATQSLFFDQDQDGDLDLYLLNHSLNPNSTYGKGANRLIPDPMAGDRIYLNENGYYRDHSASMGIYRGKTGYGLGIGAADLNQDGLTDLYIGNDFFENDYLYYNKGAEGFEDRNAGSAWLGHTSHYSMGNDLADLNNDGLIDIVSADMLPEDLVTYKTSAQEYNYQYYKTYLKNGYAPQYMQNTYHLNLGEAGFAEIGQLSGMAASEWSWSILAADFDLDGWKDLHITNGIPGATNDMDFINFIANENIQSRLGGTLRQQELEFISLLPQKPAVNYFFRNLDGQTFENPGTNWYQGKAGFSQGAVYTDLDNDGDLDLVVNNQNAPAEILENTANERFPDRHYLSIRFQGSPLNTQGIGTMVQLWAEGRVQTAQNFTTRGYLSAVPAVLHFGLGAVSKIDSIHIRWADGKQQRIYKPEADRQLLVSYDPETTLKPGLLDKPFTFAPADTLNLWKHLDPETTAFNREPLIPFAQTNRGPAAAIGDIDGDGDDDLCLGGGKTQPTAVFLQENGSFKPMETTVFEKHRINEDTALLLQDLNGDGYPELLVVSGGHEFNSGDPLVPLVYHNHQGRFDTAPVPLINKEINASGITAADIDGDGDQDLLITADEKPGFYGQVPQQFLLENSGQGKFREVTDSFAPDLLYCGKPTAASWKDLDGNGYPDLILAGHWMPVTIFMNNGKQLLKQDQNGLGQTHGWWNALKAEDMDGDGDIDLTVLNWGQNTRLKASEDKPVTLYLEDFDDNGKIDPLVTYFHGQTETPFASKEDLVKQIPFLNKKFLSFKDYAHAELSELFPSGKLKSATRLQVFELRSCYFENLGNGKYRKHPLPAAAQVSSGMALHTQDLNNDGLQDILIAGNQYEISTQLGRLDASPGLVLTQKPGAAFTAQFLNTTALKKPVRHLYPIQIGQERRLVALINNERLIFFNINTDNL